MRLIDHYFSQKDSAYKAIMSIFEENLIYSFLNLDVTNNKKLKKCRDALIKCVSDIAKSGSRISINKNKTFMSDLYFCIQATSILEDYNNTGTNYEQIIHQTVDDIFSDKKPLDFCIQDEMLNILTLLNWKKGIAQ